MRPSPARLDAPEPHVWLPIFDLTDELESLEFSQELETLDITGELELLALEQGQNDLARELEAIESGFWRTAEAEHPFLTGELPVSEARCGSDLPQPGPTDDTVAVADVADVVVRSNRGPLAGGGEGRGAARARRLLNSPTGPSSRTRSR